MDKRILSEETDRSLTICCNVAGEMAIMKIGLE